MDEAGITASPKLRVIFFVVAALMLLLWNWSLIPPIESWDNPYEDGFSYVPAFYASIVCLPAGLFLLIGAIAGHGRHVVRARSALFVGGGRLFIVVAFLIFRRIAKFYGWFGIGLSASLLSPISSFCARHTGEAADLHASVHSLAGRMRR
jgi:hypothetical protein